MSRSSFSLRSSLGLALLLVAACASSKPSARTPPATLPPSAPAPTTRESELYPAEEALRDVLSGPWEYLGTGEWPGTERTPACVFRNQRVFVVNVYCTLTEATAFRIEVFSPERGLSRIYAESKGAVSEGLRRDYFTFTADSEPRPGPAARLPPLRLNMSFEELRAYDEQRYGAHLPVCYAGSKFNRDEAGCLGALEPRTSEWAARNRTFLEQASSDWYHVVHQMRALALQHGVEPK